jgi:hypothetical protein
VSSLSNLSNGLDTHRWTPRFVRITGVQGVQVSLSNLCNLSNLSNRVGHRTLDTSYCHSFSAQRSTFFKTTEVLTALAVESKAKVHELADKAMKAGTKEPRQPHRRCSGWIPPTRKMIE